MPFADLLGHAPARELLTRALRAGRVPPSLLFSGPDGVGKRTLALALARALLCDRREDPGCGACSHCRRVLGSLRAIEEWRERARGSKDGAAMNHRLHPDLILVEPWTTTKEGEAKARAEIKVEQIRELVTETFGRPFEAKTRCFVIDGAHLMNPAAANSLLKSLEEPPPTTHFVLVSSAPQALLPTILSRCQTLRFAALPNSLLAPFLMDKLGLDAAEARLRSALSGGSVGRALEFDSGAAQALRTEALGALESGGRPLAKLEAAQRLSESDDLPLALLAMRSLLRDVAAIRAGVATGSLVNQDMLDPLSRLAKTEVGANAADLAERIQETLLAVQGNASKLLASDALVDLVP